jgi:gas vesicle protein
MPTGPASTADELTDTIRSLIDRLVDAKLTQDVAKRGAEVGALANEAWRDSRPLRRDAAKRLAEATEEATKWSDRTWRKSLRPLVKDLWNRRTIAIGAAGAAVPVGRELVDTAAVRLGIKQQQEQRHWGAFFFGLLIGAIAGAVAAMLTTPKRGEEMRRELGVKADEIATRAKDEWVPIFERATSGNGHVDEALTDITEGAADAGATAGDVVAESADEVAEAVSESADAVDRESPA